MQRGNPYKPIQSARPDTAGRRNGIVSSDFEFSVNSSRLYVMATKAAILNALWQNAFAAIFFRLLRVTIYTSNCDENLWNCSLAGKMLSIKLSILWESSEVHVSDTDSSKAVDRAVES